MECAGWFWDTRPGGIDGIEMGDSAEVVGKE